MRRENKAQREGDTQGQPARLGGKQESQTQQNERMEKEPETNIDEEKPIQLSYKS